VILNLIIVAVGLLALASIGISLCMVGVFLHSFKQTLDEIRNRNRHLAEQVDAALHQGTRLTGSRGGAVRR
jgi:uncharacterized protein YoxC